MRIAKKVAIIALCFMLLFSTTSCVVLFHKDNGKHKGWTKNSKNPHNPNSSKSDKSKKHNK